MTSLYSVTNKMPLCIQPQSIYLWSKQSQSTLRISAQMCTTKVACICMCGVMLALFSILPVFCKDCLAGETQHLLDSIRDAFF